MGSLENNNHELVIYNARFIIYLRLRVQNTVNWIGTGKSWYQNLTLQSGPRRRDQLSGSHCGECVAFTLTLDNLVSSDKYEKLQAPPRSTFTRLASS